MVEHFQVMVEHVSSTTHPADSCKALPRFSCSAIERSGMN